MTLYRPRCSMCTSFPNHRDLEKGFGERFGEMLKSERVANRVFVLFQFGMCDSDLEGVESMSMNHEVLIFTRSLS